MNNYHSTKQSLKQEDLIFRIFSRNPKEREMLRKKHLVIVGIGSVGSAIAVMAARAGVGKFTLIDNDDIDAENLGRHVCDLSHRFRSKTEALSLNDPRKYTDLGFDQTKVPGQAGLWPNILIICGFAFQVILALWGDEKRDKQLLDFEHTLLLVNVGDFDSPLQPLAVTPASVEKGCAICDEGKLAAMMDGAR